MRIRPKIETRNLFITDSYPPLKYAHTQAINLAEFTHDLRVSKRKRCAVHAQLVKYSQLDLLGNVNTKD